ncbi:MAG TPA: protease pro-enzyme activation domain-containing protein [Bryobacteraceae bacterium]|nr:protease pro-enzyme activation domain-containing protein [Bryobacteraceae bacterium]
MNNARTSIVPGHVHRLAQPAFDRGPVDPAKKLSYMVLLVKPSAAQQSDLDGLLFDQQNPASPSFRNWLTPEQFGNRFGLNSSDQSKVVAWLTSQGFAIDHSARSANWIAFSGTAAQVSNALHTPIHQFEVNGVTHFANTAIPSVPEALSDIVGGILGLHDFYPVSNAIKSQPDFTTGTAHYMAPADFSTIYDVGALYTAGIDGTGQNIVVVGESDVLLSDITKFRSTYGLPANNPKMILYGGADPGLTGAQFEGNLDIEWSGAVAPKATIYYVYGQDAFTAIIASVELGLAPIISASYSTCEVDGDPSYRAIVQQGNAQGITILTASGDAGAAACDSQGAEPFATRGRAVNFPAVLPEVTGVGGTQFVEGNGTFWNPTNAATTNGSAISYIPEAAWNESNTSGIDSTGGGASVYYSKPAWQSGPGVPGDNARDVPDISLSAALHDGYLVTYEGGTYISGGTSCSTPSMAAILALLNHYQVTNKIQKTAGLGNVNPQLYRLAQSAPTAFHDVINGNNIVQCAQGSPDCLTGSFGYTASVAYDLTTGLGSVDANNLVTMWNTAVNATTLTLSANVTKATLNDTIQLTATVGPAAATGTVSFNYYTTPLGSATLSAGSATISVPLYQIGFAGSIAFSAQYSGDASYSPSGATRTIQVTTPSGVTSIVPSAPTTVFPQPADAQGLSWQTSVSLIEVAGVPALITGLTIDGAAQSLSQYFPSPQIAPKGTVTANFVFRGLAAPVIKTFVFTGTDPTGLVWTRQVAVNFATLPTYDYGNFNATPLTVAQNPANAACPWSVQLNLDDQGGFGVNIITDLQAGSVDYATSIASIFGTTRLDAYGSIAGTLCFSGITPPAIDSIFIELSDGGTQNLTVSFVGPPANPGTLSAAPATLSLAASAQPVTATLGVNLSDKTQQWTASIYPANRTSSWLTASQLSGTGSGAITLTANPAGFEPGAYRAIIVLQSQNSVPQYINVPVMFVISGSALSLSQNAATTISAVANSASFKTQVSPGMLMSVFGAGLANSVATNSGSPLPYSLAGVSATVDGLAAPVIYASPTMLNIQVPFAAGAGPAVLGVNNNGQVAGFQFQMSPSSPGVFADANGNVLPTPTVKAGTALALYVTGTGDVAPALKTAYSPASGTALANLPVPVLPLSVTIGGQPAFLEFAGITPGLIGVTQVNILVPSTIPLGNEPIVVTVGGVSSVPVNVVVQ